MTQSVARLPVVLLYYLLTSDLPTSYICCFTYLTKEVFQSSPRYRSVDGVASLQICLEDLHAYCEVRLAEIVRYVPSNLVVFTPLLEEMTSQLQYGGNDWQFSDRPQTSWIQTWDAMNTCLFPFPVSEHEVVYESVHLHWLTLHRNLIHVPIRKPNLRGWLQIAAKLIAADLGLGSEWNIVELFLTAERFFAEGNMLSWSEPYWHSNKVHLLVRRHGRKPARKQASWRRDEDTRLRRAGASWSTCCASLASDRWGVPSPLC